MIPSYQFKYTKYPICKGDVITIFIPTWTPPYVDFELIGPMNNCTASIMATRSIKYDTKQLENPPLDHVYLAEGSTVTILPEDVISATSTYVWLFPSYELAYKAEKDGIDHVIDKDQYECDHPNNGALCGRISQHSNGSLVIRIKKSAYYFMRCVEFPNFNCSSLKKWNYTKVSYNFTSDNDAGNNPDLIRSDAGTTRIDLRHAYFESVTQWKTVLAKLNDGCYKTCYNYFILTKYITHYQEIGLYLLLTLLVVFVVAVFSIILLLLYCLKFKNN